MRPVTVSSQDQLLALKNALSERDEALHLERKERERLAGELRLTRTERDLLRERLLALQRKLFAAKSEVRGSDQKDLFLNEAEALAPTDQTPAAEADEEESTQVAGHKRKKRGRKPLDPNLPRDIVRHELPEGERVCAHDGSALVEIGAEVSEQMHVIPEQVRVLQHHRIKYACPCCDLSLKVAPAPARIIPRAFLPSRRRPGSSPASTSLGCRCTVRPPCCAALAATSPATPSPREWCALAWRRSR